jgi:hypothetical protein
MAGPAEIGTDEIQDGSAGGCGGSRIDGGWRGEGLGGIEGAVAIAGEERDLAVVGGSDDVEFAVAVKVVDDSGEGIAAGDGVWGRGAEGAVCVAEHDVDLGSAGNVVAVDDDEVAVAVAVEICGGEEPGAGEAQNTDVEAGGAGEDVERFGLRHNVVKDTGVDVYPRGCFADVDGGTGSDSTGGVNTTGGRGVGVGGEAGFGVERALIVWRHPG